MQLMSIVETVKATIPHLLMMHLIKQLVITNDDVLLCCLRLAIGGHLQGLHLHVNTKDL